VRIESIDFFYLAMPEILAIGDGSQDALLVRARADGVEGWGECEAAPLVSIASLVCPMSHSACRPVRDSVLGQRLIDPSDIERIGNEVRRNSLDLLQTDHTLSGIEIALWDLLGKKLQEPVYRLLGYAKAFPKTPYASQLFGDDPPDTLRRARQVVQQGYTAAKFGWGTFGQSLADDEDHVRAAREGLGREAILLIDAGTVWQDDVQEAARRIPILTESRALWLEEPFVSGALRAYRELAGQAGSIRLAGGEGSHNAHLAQHLIDHAGIGYIQIDTGRIGGIAPARQVAGYADQHNVQYVNHTFTSHLALSASLQPYAGLERHILCETPVDPKPLAGELTIEHLERDAHGQIVLPEAPGLGIQPDPEAIQKYLQPVEIAVGGKVLYRTPSL